MSEAAAADSNGALAANIMYFGRVLRDAGLPIGTGRVIAAIAAVDAVGVGDRHDFYWALHAVFVNRRDQHDLFDQAFNLFWRNPDYVERMAQMMMFSPVAPPDENREEPSRRVTEAMYPKGMRPRRREEEEEREIEIDATMTYSEREVLRDMDFEKMTAEEIAAAKKSIQQMRLPIMKVPTRRFEIDGRGRRIAMRASLRAALRFGGDIIPLRHQRRKLRHPPLVMLCDISGSMSRYSRMFIHFMHAVTNDRDRVHTFLFGTRLTNITRYLRYKDVDFALERITGSVEDWSGGTRIGQCLSDFNRDWSRRVLGQGAVVVLISDGLDLDAGTGLEGEMERLHKSCRRLIWLNPLLRYEDFAPKSLGVKAILPHVDDFRTVHNLASLEDLARVLSRQGPRREEGVSRWREAAA